MRRFATWIVLVGMMLASVSQGFAEELEVNLGTPVAEAEVQQRAITIFPDGRGLPPGSGSVGEGTELYRTRCGYCHGETGTEGPASRLVGSDGWLSLSDPLRILRIQKSPLLVMSVGAQWPHATSIFDYVRRAMPHMAPKSLTNDEVYALTAYILYLNELVAEDAILTKKNLPGVEMPGRDRSHNVWRGK
ncbi:MAG: cytochrome c [Deltaproteobacteria bacterium]|nr:cytochrome c [Deltaproteobacteria bacterium]MBW2397223.1 cytochrome c [Deltaproteobacteria bacterium]